MVFEGRVRTLALRIFTRALDDCGTVHLSSSHQAVPMRRRSAFGQDGTLIIS